MACYWFVVIALAVQRGTTKVVTTNVPIEVTDKSTVLEPQITMPNVLKPEQSVNIKVSEKNGKAMTYTIAVVDEGLLDLTRFKTPMLGKVFTHAKP